MEEAGRPCPSSVRVEEVEACPSLGVVAVAVEERLGRPRQVEVGHCFSEHCFSVHLFSFRRVPSFPWLVLGVRVAQVEAELPPEEAGVVEPVAHHPLAQGEQEGLRGLQVEAEGVAEGRRLEEEEGRPLYRLASCRTCPSSLWVGWLVLKEEQEERPSEALVGLAAWLTAALAAREEAVSA